MLISKDLGCYLEEIRQPTVSGKIGTLTIHDDPDGKMVTFLFSYNHKELIGSIVVESIPEEVMEALAKKKFVNFEGSIENQTKFKTKGMVKETVLPLKGRLYV